MGAVAGPRRSTRRRLALGRLSLGGPAQSGVGAVARALWRPLVGGGRPCAAGGREGGERKKKGEGSILRRGEFAIEKSRARVARTCGVRTLFFGEKTLRTPRLRRNALLSQWVLTTSLPSIKDQETGSEESKDHSSGWIGNH